MTLSFIETMRGRLLANDGTESRVDFQGEARSAGRPGHFNFTGVVHCPPWLDEGPCEGTLVISAKPAAITYCVRFTGADGTPLSLEGAKSLTLRAPVRSVTELPIVLRGRRELACGLLRFDLLELPSFLVSWLPLRSLPRRRFTARHRAVTRRHLTEGGR